MYAIWCFAEHENGDWLREHEGKGFLTFQTKEEAEKRAAQEFGFLTYQEALANGYCQVESIAEFNISSLLRSMSEENRRQVIKQFCRSCCNLLNQELEQNYCCKCLPKETHLK